MGEASTQERLGGVAMLADARSGRVYLLEGQATPIGRSPRARLVIDDPYLSRCHARIVSRGNAFWLEDLASANGSFVNRRPVTAPTRLSEGDEIVLGATTLRFQRRVSPALPGGAHG